MFVGGLEDLMVELQTTNRSKCSWLVDRAYEGEYGFTKLSFLVSQDWVDVGPLTPPPGWPGCDNYTMSGAGGGVQQRRACWHAPARAGGGPRQSLHWRLVPLPGDGKCQSQPAG